MLKREIALEFFVESSNRNPNGEILPAPPIAQLMFETFRRNWHQKDVGPNKTTMVSMGPCVQNGMEGYSIKCEVVHKK